jgi:NADH dehydrogenase/NADH:ubiquinone oxidoreductase subunit G
MVYEDNETYLNTQGFVKRMGKLLDFRKDAKTNWQLTRKLYSSVNSLTFYNNKKDNQLVQFDCINSFNFKNYLSFQHSATQTLTSLSYYLIKQNSPIIKSVNTPFKSIKTKIFNTKVKYWLDDFFNTNGRDSFSYNSSVLANCSKVLRSSSTNFF